MNISELQKIKQRYSIVGNSDELNHALDVALQVAPTSLSVLIFGESGAGRKIIPRVIHDRSPRRREQYFAISCGSIPEGTIDSELFGHEKGSFTGAIGESEGYFGITNKGTIFLDEVGELPLATQARLLRVLETGEYIRAGGQEIHKTGVRITVTTNVNMPKTISEGRFREDLYYRLNTIPIKMPPLRDRGEDVILLFRLLSMQMAEKHRLPKISLTGDVKQLMLNYKWPDSVRRLENITEQTSVLVKGRRINVQLLQQSIPHDPESTQLAPISSQGSHSYESEREILYKILYELRDNVGDLRRDMNNLRKQLDEAQQQNIGVAYQGQVQALDNRLAGYPNMSQHLQVTAPQVNVRLPADLENAIMEEVAEPESLNLNGLGRKMVEKALERNGGNREKATQGLDISDRTLYRRIEQYGLDKS